jgi:hypothetical protein
MTDRCTPGVPAARRRARATAHALTSLLLALAASAPACAQTRASPLTPVTSAEAAMTLTASGTFDVKLTPQPADGYTDAATLGRMSIDKQFHGDLDATSKGQMLTGMGGVKGSAGYVAIERVSGTLSGRRGTFVLQHSGTMTRGAPQLSVTVVPDSGTDELAGIAGRMTIDVANGQHAYTFEYTLAPAP